MPSIHPYRIIPYSLVHTHTRGVSTRCKRNQLIRRLSTYHAKQRQCLNSPKRVTIDKARAEALKQSRSVYNDCFKHSDLLKVSTSACDVSVPQRVPPPDANRIVSPREMHLERRLTTTVRRLTEARNVPAPLRVY